MKNAHETLKLPADPSKALLEWLAAAEASGVPEPTAMTLATVDASGRPQARIVLYKGFGEGGLQFFTNYDSPKARELQAHPYAAVVFHWKPLGRQIRIEGGVARTSDAVSDLYFASRPRGSQAGAWASPQSQPLQDREELIARLREVEVRFAGREVPRPPNWGGFVLRPERYEFWEEREFRLHERIVYRQHGSGWLQERLAP